MASFKDIVGSTFLPGLYNLHQKQKDEQKKAERQAQFQNIQQMRKERAIQAKEIRRSVARSRVAQAQAQAAAVATQGTATGSVPQGQVAAERSGTAGNIQFARNISGINRSIFASQLQQQKYQRRADTYGAQFNLVLDAASAAVGFASPGAALGTIGFNALKNSGGK